MTSNPPMHQSNPPMHEYNPPMPAWTRAASPNKRRGSHQYKPKVRIHSFVQKRFDGKNKRRSKIESHSKSTSIFLLLYYPEDDFDSFIGSNILRCEDKLFDAKCIICFGIYESMFCWLIFGCAHKTCHQASVITAWLRRSGKRLRFSSSQWRFSKSTKARWSQISQFIFHFSFLSK